MLNGRHVIIADDATGANDAALQFYGAGVPVRVLYDHAAPCKDGVTVVDTDSRNLPPEKARSRMRGLLERLGLPPGSIVKKVDSTLRGNIAAEIEAMLAYAPGSAALVAPAYPALGRTTRGGVHLVNGVPVSGTEFARDPRSPVKTSAIAELFGEPCCEVSVSDIRKGAEPLCRLIEKKRAQGMRLFVFDIEIEGDLEEVGKLHKRLPDAYMAGSAGLMRYLLPVQDRIDTPAGVRGPVLYAIGSLSKKSREQLEAFSGQDVYKWPLDPAGLLSCENFDTQISRICRALREGKHAVMFLSAEQNARDAAVRYAKENGMDGETAAGQLCGRFGALAACVAKAARPGCIFSAGGDISKSIYASLGVSSLEVCGRLEEGVPVLKNPVGETLFVTKAGGFGSREVLRKLADRAE